MDTLIHSDDNGICNCFRINIEDSTCRLLNQQFISIDNNFNILKSLRFYTEINHLSSITIMEIRGNN